MNTFSKESPLAFRPDNPQSIGNRSIRCSIVVAVAIASFTAALPDMMFISFRAAPARQERDEWESRIESRIVADTTICASAEDQNREALIRASGIADADFTRPVCDQSRLAAQIRLRYAEGMLSSALRARRVNQSRRLVFVIAMQERLLELSNPSVVDHAAKWQDMEAKSQLLQPIGSMDVCDDPIPEEEENRLRQDAILAGLPEYASDARLVEIGEMCPCLLDLFLRLHRPSVRLSEAVEKLVCDSRLSASGARLGLCWLYEDGTPVDTCVGAAFARRSDHNELLWTLVRFARRDGIVEPLADALIGKLDSANRNTVKGFLWELRRETGSAHISMILAQSFCERDPIPGCQPVTDGVTVSEVNKTSEGPSLTEFADDLESQ